MIDKARAVYGWSGIIEGEIDFTVCDENGETDYGDLTESILDTTWIEL
jgi:hypothetical protein